MPPTPNKSYDSHSAGQLSRTGPERDITWDRPVFRPPVLPNPRVIFDPLPFMASRLNANSRQVLSH